ncbi:MAG: photosynthetic protein synthase I, partial [Methylococcales bacterium]
LTAPYMHNGSLNTLEQVVHFYNQGGINNALLDPIIEPLHLTAQEISDLLEFLKTLTGNNNHELH